MKKNTVHTTKIVTIKEYVMGMGVLKKQQEVKDLRAQKDLPVKVIREDWRLHY